MYYISWLRQREHHEEQHTKGTPKNQEPSCLQCYPFKTGQRTDERFTTFWDRYCEPDYEGSSYTQYTIDEFHRLLSNNKQIPDFDRLLRSIIFDNVTTHEQYLALKQRVFDDWKRTQKFKYYS